MEVVRQSAFETNSSSCHSLIIKGGDYAPSYPPLYVENGVCKIFPGSFGWGPELFKDSPTKAAYCLTWARNYSPTKKEHLDMLKWVIEEETKAKVHFQTGTGYWENGFIDHQSADRCKEAFASKKTLRDFIFNNESFLVIDNDNH